MEHLDERALTALADSQPQPPTRRDGDHLASCAECRALLATLAELHTEVRTRALTGTATRGEPQLLLAPGEQVEHFRVESSLGGGGMAQVYLATDTRLDRKVVLKVIRPELLDSPEAIERFLFEARATARFSHPHIVIIHGVGEHRGVPYLVLEHLDGADLRTHLQQGAFDRAERLRVALAVAEALREAHRRGVLHLDLKPGNVFVTAEGAVRVLDFGLAKSLGARHAVMHQALAGTPGYMAPEQWRGSEAGGATDVWALGIMLYELCAGRRPFTGSAVTALALRVCSDEPLPPLPADVEPALARLIHACLDRDPAERPSAAQAAEVLRGLREGAGRSRPEKNDAVPAATPILAVLPLSVRGDGAADFGDAITDELIDLLSRMRGWKVLSGAATARYRDGWEPRTVAAELGVQAIVHGTVQLSGERVRVTARLVDARTGSQTWSGRYGGSSADILELSDTLSRRVAEALRAEITAAVRGGDASAEAVGLYLRARQKLGSDRLFGADGAVELLERCLEIAPSFAPAMSAHALASMRAWYTPDGRELRDWEPVVRHSVSRALQHAPDIAETHVVAGRLRIASGNYLDGVRDLGHALDIAPTCAAAHGYLAMLQCEGGRAAEGLRRARLALDLDPTLFNSLFDIGRIHSLMGQWDAYEATIRELEGRAPPKHSGVRLMQMRVAAWRGDHERMRRLLVEIDALPNTQTLGVPGRVILGEMDLARALELFRRDAGPSAHPRFRSFAEQLYAETCFLVGAHDAGAELFMKSATTLLVDVEWVDRCTALQPMRSRPEFAAARAQVHRRAEALWSEGAPPLDLA